MFKACSHDHVDVVKMLLKAGAIDKNGEALKIATEKGHIDIRLFMEQDVKIQP